MLPKKRQFFSKTYLPTTRKSKYSPHFTYLPTNQKTYPGSFLVTYPLECRRSCICGLNPSAAVDSSLLLGSAIIPPLDKWPLLRWTS